MTLEIRQLLPADAAVYRELMLDAYARHPTAFTASVEERKNLPLSWWTQRTSQVTGAFAEGKLVGAAGLEPDPRPKTKHRAKLFGMYVVERARRHGTGRRLVEAILEKAKRTPGLEVVYLTVIEDNEPARKLYEACGFETFGREPMAIAEAGKYLAKVHMWTRLEPQAAAAAAVARAPEFLHSERLVFRRLREADLANVLATYAGDAEVTRYLSWPRHQSAEDGRIFLALSDSQWNAGPVGPYLLEAAGELVGSIGLEFQTPYRAAVGYVLAKDAWGRGYASEALGAMIGLARELGAWRLETIVHVDHAASARVLEKAGFTREGLLRRHTIFPNLDPRRPADVFQFGLALA